MSDECVVCSVENGEMKTRFFNQVFIADTLLNKKFVLSLTPKWVYLGSHPNSNANISVKLLVQQLLYLPSDVPDAHPSLMVGWSEDIERMLAK